MQRPRVHLAFLLAFVMASLSVPSATAADGDKLWAKRFNGSGNSADVGFAVITDGQRVYVAGSGYRSDTNPPDYVTLAYDAATGDKLWAKRYNGPANSYDFATSVATDGQRVYVTGSSRGADAYEYATVAYDAATGDRLWVRRYDGPGNGSDDASSVATDGQRVYVTGSSAALWTSFRDYATVAYDAATGAVLWVRRYDGPEDDNNDFADSLVTDGVRVYVTGLSEKPYTSTDYDADYTTLAYDAATGARLWLRRYDGPGKGFDDAESVGTDGTRVYVTGSSPGLDTGRDYATVAYDAARGALLWVRRYEGPANSDDVAQSLATDGQRAYVTGWSGLPGTPRDYATVAYDATTGERLWLKRYGLKNGSDFAYSVATNGQRVYVTGQSRGSGTYFDYATAAYDVTTGATLWVRRYNGRGTGTHIAYSVAADGQRVYVTGESQGAGTSFDVATLAYQA